MQFLADEILIDKSLQNITYYLYNRILTQQYFLEYSMNTTAIKRMTIIQELSRIPETSLDTVINYLESLLKDNQTQPPTNQSLKGIWKGAGFEKLLHIEDELDAIRKELQTTILKRKL